jgi:hypothetical protein
MTTAPSITKPRSEYASELDWLRAQVDMLSIWRDDALETLAESDRMIGAQQRRIEEIEVALRKTRNSAWDIYFGTRTVLHDPLMEEPKPEDRKKSKKKDRS